MWRGIKAGLVRFAVAARGFFPRLRLCVFFHGVPTKKGLHWCLFLLYQATTSLNRQIVCFWLSVQRRFLQIHVENIALLRIFPILRSRVAADAPSAYTTLLPGCPNHRKDPLPATFLTNASTHSSPFSASRIFKYVRSIQRQKCA